MPGAMFPNQYNGATAPSPAVPQSYGFGQPQLPMQIPQLPRNINFVLVRGIDDAMSRMTEPNCIGAFFDQDQDLFYRITTDMYGAKTYKVFKYTEVQMQRAQSSIIPENTSEYVSKKDFDEFKQQLLSMLGGKQNGESDERQHTVCSAGTEPAAK